MTKNISIRKRLNWYVIVAMLTMLAVTGAVIYKATKDEANEIFDAKMSLTARVLESFISREAIALNSAKLQEALENSINSPTDKPHKYKNKLFFVVRDDNGNNLLNGHLAPDLGSIKNKQGYLRISIEGNEWTIYTHKASQDDLWIIVGEQAEIRSEINEHLGAVLLIPLIFLLPFILLLLWKLVGIALIPLRAVVDQVRQQDITHLRKIEVAGIPQEIEPLVIAFNQMLEKLDAGYARERRFVSDASHELRNPLAALLINIDNAIEENQNPELGESLSSMKLSIKRLSHLVAQLFELSHSEHPSISQLFDKVDIVSLCAQVVESYTLNARQQHQNIKVRVPSNECYIKGVDSLLTSLISNLLDNAIKYSGDGCEIWLKLEFDHDDLILSVDDSGKGLDSDMRSKVTRRFFRASGPGITGAGLGLSIVNTIADIHSAKLSLTRSTLGGLSVSIRFPNVK